MSAAADFEHVAIAVQQLPPGARHELSHGPMEEPYCRICEVLKHRGSVSGFGDIIVDFHDLGDDEFVEATHGALGTDRRLTNEEFRAGMAEKRRLESFPERNVQRALVESLSGNLMWYRCLYVYALAGWCP